MEIHLDKKDYFLAEMQKLFNIGESQADRLAAAILMPRFTVDRALNVFYKGKRSLSTDRVLYHNRTLFKTDCGDLFLFVCVQLILAAFPLA